MAAKGISRKYGFKAGTGLVSMGRWVAVCLFLSVFVCSCGYSREEKNRMKEIESLGRENAEAYIQGKYGFEPEIQEIVVCTERGEHDPRPWANGYVLVRMSYEGEVFRVHINGEEPGAEGRDDYQQELILREGKAFFEELLGYEIYDLYLEYGESGEKEKTFPKCHRGNFIGECYESGGFEDLLWRHPANIRIDDCGNRDLTRLWEERSEAAAFLEEYAADGKGKIVVISYKSREDYERGYDHSYGRSGILDFDICNDGLYLCSYAAFEEEGAGAKRFELQEYDGVIGACVDREAGRDLLISDGASEWQELGETGKRPFSAAYSVERKGTDETVVYLPVERWGRGAVVFIQHRNDGEWRQYEANVKMTRDKKYLFFTFRGFSEERFEFAVWGRK